MLDEFRSRRITGSSSVSNEHRSFTGRHILVAEDDGMIAEAICERLTDAGYEVVARCETGSSAVETALALRPDLILMDVRLKGDFDGIRASELINEKTRVPVVYLTGDSDQKTLHRAKAASAYGYVLKPFHIRNLIVAIEVAIDRFEMERRLEDTQLTYATILGSIADGVIAVDTQGRVRFMNEVAERLTGWSSRDAQLTQWRTVVNIVEAGGVGMAVDLIAQVLNTRRTVSLGRDALVISRAGIRVPVDGGITCAVDPLGRAVGASIALRDVTSVRKSESDLKLLAEQLRAVIDTAVDGVLMLDAAGTILMLNPACERLFGYASEELIGLNINSVMPSPMSATHDCHWHIDHPQAPPLVVRAHATTCRRRDLSTFPAEISVGEACNPGQQPLFVSIVHDVSERRELEAELLDAVGREQRRFGTDLHDGLGQELTGLSLLLSALTNTARAAHSPHAADLAQAYEVVRHALLSCQSIARGLSPIGATKGGLIGALHDLVTRLKGSSGPNVNISVSEVSRLGLSPAASDHLYRIAQEALTNALKHAHASSINVMLDVERERVRLEINDDGEGVEGAGENGPGLGMRSMQYRASMIGARLEITPFRPNGTRVICECPQAG
jgi:two-component system, LuxR family, sensor kinase FixL